MTFNEKSTDEELLAGCIQQHRLAQKYLYQRYFGRLLGIAMRYTRNREDASSILNLAFLKIFDSVQQYRHMGAFGGWMARIVLNTAIDHVRSQVQYRKMMDFETAGDRSIPGDAVDQLAAEDLFRLVQQLPAATRTVFSLYAIDGYKHHEIADMLGIDEGTSKWHLSNARAKLRDMLQLIDKQTTAAKI
jgi:RNA polymerase sigma factor (sigma-70 family)